METIHYKNKYCKIVSPEYMPGVYKVVSLKNKYNDQYFTTLEQAKKSIGLIPESYKYTFIKQ